VAAAVAAPAFLLAGACGGGIGAGRASPGVVENGAFRPTRAPVANYGPNPSLACPERGINGLVDSEVGAVAKPDGRLCAVAETLLGWEASDTPPEAVLVVVSADFGLPQTVRRIVLTSMETAEESSRGTTPGASPKDVATSLAEPIKTFASTAQVPRYGLATQRVKKGVTKVSLVMQDQTLDLQPLPRKLNPGQSAKLSGTLLGNLTAPKVQFTDAVGKLEKAEGQAGKSFTADLKCGDRPGRIVVQVMAEKEGSDVVVANFPVGCGTELPIAAAAAAAPATGQAATVDPAAAEKQLVELINKDRTSAGLKALDVDNDLAKVARSLSEDRAKGKGTTSEEVQRRLKELDISAPTILVSEAQAFTAEDAYQRFSNSPQDRSNAMNPEMTQLGIGAAAGPVINNRPMVIVTELFLKQLPPPNAEQVKADLYKAIARRRTDARAPAVSKDAQLEQVAQTYAAQLAKDKGKVPKEKVAEIESPLYKSFATVNEIGGVRSDPLEFAEEPAIVGDARLVGVGVGIGSSPNFGKNSTYVVILMGKKGAAKGAARQQPVKRK
jgi:uncharacterized protein YkwD